FRQVLRKVNSDGLRECIEPENRDLSFALIVESEIALAPVTLKHGRLVLAVASDPFDLDVRACRSVEEVCDHSMANVAFVSETELAHALRDKLRGRNIVDADDHVALSNLSFRRP